MPLSAELQFLHRPFSTVSLKSQIVVSSFKTVKDKQSWTLVKVLKVLYSLLTVRKRAKLHSNLLKMIWNFKGRRGCREGEEEGTQLKNYKVLVSTNVIREAQSASWQLWKLGFFPPPETVRQRSCPC